jgi:hypothetical protein
MSYERSRELSQQARAAFDAGDFNAAYGLIIKAEEASPDQAQMTNARLAIDRARGALQPNAHVEHPACRIHDYRQVRRWGHDITSARPQRGDSQLADLAGFGEGVFVDDFVVVPSGGRPAIYVVQQISYMSDPADMWTATGRFVSGATDLGRAVSRAMGNPKPLDSGQWWWTYPQ